VGGREYSHILVLPGCPSEDVPLRSSFSELDFRTCCCDGRKCAAGACQARAWPFNWASVETQEKVVLKPCTRTRVGWSYSTKEAAAPRHVPCSGAQCTCTEPIHEVICALAGLPDGTGRSR
jgi:hypothetical protein